ncbi:MAG TPA: response regulator transcription factor [Steroidobacteraceae bacterium]|nr:response regulator transcription factor [Steroidobacteraceae bacterium]
MVESAGFESVAKRVLIADDHPLYRDALRAIVPQACPSADLHEAACQDDVLRVVASDASFDLIALDLMLPGATGLSCLRKVRERAPFTPVLIVSASDDPNTMSEVMRAGATGFVPKSAHRQMLIDAIRVVLGGGTYLPLAGMTALRESPPAARADDPASGVGTLTSQQRRVLDHLAQGQSNKQIAGHLQISEITVKAHVSSILRKLGVTNRVQAALEARKVRAER